MSFKIGDEVIYNRADNRWGRIRNERVSAVVVAITPKRVKVKLLNGIINSTHALVDPARLELAR